MIRTRKDRFKKTSVDVAREIEKYTQLLRKSYKEYKINTSRTIPQHFHSNSIPIQIYNPTYAHPNSLSDSQLTDEEFCRDLQYKVGDCGRVDEVCNSKVIKRLLDCNVKVQSEVIKNICLIIAYNWMHNTKSISPKYLKLILFLLEEFQSSLIKHVC